MSSGTVAEMVRRRARTWLGVALVASTTLVGCSAGKGDDIAQGTADRFVEQVNTNTCDEASGFDINDTTWTAACEATVANLADGATLPIAEMYAADSGETQRNYIMLSPYTDTTGVSATLHIELDGSNLLATDATLVRISSGSAAAIGETGFFQYGGAADTIEPDGQALVERVQGLLLTGDCDEIEALLAPATAFPGTVNTAECESVAMLYAAHPPASGDWESWHSAVYSAVDIAQSDEAYGLTKAEDEDHFDFFDRVMEEISPVNRKVSLFMEDPKRSIEVVLFEGQWYLLDIEIEVQTFAFQF